MRAPVVRNPDDAFSEISAQANDSYTFAFVLYKIHMAISSFFLNILSNG